MLCQSAQELVALGRVGSFVGNRPDNHVGTVLVAANHVGQLPFGILVSFGVFPCNGPVNGNLRPHQDSHTLSLAHGILVVWIVSQSDEVAAKFLCPAEQCVGICCAIGASATVCFLLVNADAAQEDGLSVEQELFATRFDGAETNLVSYKIADSRTIGGLSVERQFRPIAFRIIGTPQRESLGRHANRETGKALGIGRALLLHLQFRYFQRQLLTSHRLVQSCRHRYFTLAGFDISLLQLQLEILDIRGRHPHKEYIAGDAAIVPPVEYLCGHGLGLALVVHFHDDRVFSVL